MKKTLITLSLLIALSFSAFADGNLAGNDLNSLLPKDPNVKTGVLDNGMTFFIRKNNKPEKRAHFRIVIKAGALDEDDDQNGLAHFCEHMAFNGTKNFPKNNLIEYLQKSGIRFGADLNASTGYEQTMYELPIPSDDPEFMKKAFQILQDWASNVSYNAEDIDSERGVIMSEWRQRNDYRFRLRDNMFKTIYKGSKITKRNIIGDTAILQNFKHDVIRRFYKDWYRPDNMAIIAVGDFNSSDIETLIKSTFGTLTNPRNPRKRDQINVPFHKGIIAGVSTDKELPVEIANAYMKLPEFTQNTFGGFRESAKRNLFDIMLNERIQELSKKENPPFLSAGGGENDMLGNIRAYNISVATAPGGIKKGLDAVLLEIARIRSHGFLQSELDRAIRQIRGSYDKYLADKNTVENARYVSEYTNVFIAGDSYPGIDTEFRLMNTILDGMKLSEVNELSKLYFTFENTALTAAFPENSPGKLSESELIETFTSLVNRDAEPYVDASSNRPLIEKLPKPGKITSKVRNEKLDLYTYKLQNGATVVLKPTNFKDNEIIFSATSKGGYSTIGDEDYLKCQFAAEIVGNSGIGTFSQTELEKALVGKSLQVYPSIDDYEESIKAITTKNDLETMLQIVYLYFTDPCLDKTAANSYLSKAQSYLSGKGNNPESVFEDSATVNLFLKNLRKKPYTNDELAKVVPEKAFEFFKQRFSSADDFRFVFVGDFDLNSMEKFVEQYIGALPQSSVSEVATDRNIRYSHGSTKIYKKGKEDRSHVRIVIPTDFVWSTSSRHQIRSTVEALDIKVNEVIREKMSGVYSPSVYQQFSNFPKSSVELVVEFVCKPDMTNDIINATFKIMEDMKNQDDLVTLEKVRKAQEKSREVTLKNNNYWIASLSSYLESGESIDNILLVEQEIKNLNLQTIKSVARKHFVKEKAVVTINEPESVN